MQAIIFDLGNVLVRWNPENLYCKIFGDAGERKQFLQEVCPLEWHTEQDRGRDMAEATEERIAQFPQHAEAIRAYYSRWNEMFGEVIEETVVLLHRLRERGYALYALSNWNAALFEQTREQFTFLQLFDGIVLSGAERLVKPDPALYQLLLDRYSLRPEQTLFIDDREENTEAAEALGIRSLVFTDAVQLEKDLIKLKILDDATKA